MKKSLTLLFLLIFASSSSSYAGTAQDKWTGTWEKMGVGNHHNKVKILMLIEHVKDNSYTIDQQKSVAWGRKIIHLKHFVAEKRNDTLQVSSIHSSIRYDSSHDTLHVTDGGLIGGTYRRSSP